MKSGMKPEQWRQVERLFQAALERPPGERAAFLTEACGEDADLRREVESLVASYDQADSFIETAAVHQAETIGLPAAEEAQPVVGRQIGPYKVIRELGQGGMGAVYLAVRADDRYQKRVAIKVVKRGMDTDFVLRRFRTEQQILASLNHPDIAKLFDAGATEDGLSYFVMEYVEGQPIYEYCNRQKLSIAERLKLFRRICAAVHYAHQNLVVHRDLKPGNILVTADGAPKLLDFGIAKLLNPELSFQTIDPTASIYRLMTPEYASPEQVRGETITTASDVYSLGVILYELLTGHRPYRLKSRSTQEMAQVICEQEPDKPSTAVARVETVPGPGGVGGVTLTPEVVSRVREGPPERLRRRLAGDLDNIVMKALSKEPQRRYASVEQLAEDILRHLEGKPVIARRDTLLYRSGKFVRRHRAAVLAAGLVALTLVVGVVGTVWQAQVARAERARAERRFNDVRKLANSFMFEFHEAIANLPGSTPARELLVKNALQYLDSLAHEAGNDPLLQRELATAYQKVGDIQGLPYQPNLGDSAGALASYRKAQAIQEPLAGVTKDPKDHRNLSLIYSRIGDMLLAGGDAAGALEVFRKMLPIDETLAAADPGGKAASRDLSIVYQRVGEAMAHMGDFPGAMEKFRQAQAIHEKRAAADPTNPQNRRDLSAIYGWVGRALAELGDPADAMKMHRKALAIDEQMMAADPADRQARQFYAASHDYLGELLARTGDTAGALASFQKVIAVAGEFMAADPKDAGARHIAAIGLRKAGRVLAEQGDLAGALEQYRKALGHLQSLAAADPDSVYFSGELAENYISMGLALARRGDAAAALDYSFKARDTAERLAAASPTNTLLSGLQASIYSKTGKVYQSLAADARTPAARQVERWREARTWHERGLEILLGLQNRGAWTLSEYGNPEKVKAAIAECDAALTKLGGAPAGAPPN